MPEDHFMIALSRISIKFLFAIAAVAVLSGCLRQQPVYNVTEKPFPTNVATKLSLDEIYQAISVAGIGRQDSWTFERQSNNVAIGTINVRNKHTAKVRVPFSNEKFSILYESSTGLLFDGSQIHRNYNKWIGHLAEDILLSTRQAAAAK